jgi:hypothetical protein
MEYSANMDCGDLMGLRIFQKGKGEPFNKSPFIYTHSLG